MATTHDVQRRSTREEALRTIAHSMHHGVVPVAIAVTDLDGFALINDRHGMDAGDRVLEAWDRVLRTNVPADAGVFRVGGDEYVVVLPGMSAENALVLMEEIRGHFRAKRVNGVSEELSASVGVAAQPPFSGTAEDLWRAAGEALMRAKREGRDRVAMYVEEKMVLKSNYYSRANLERLAKLSSATDRTEASLLREALDDLFVKYREQL